MLSDLLIYMKTQFFDMRERDQTLQPESRLHYRFSKKSEIWILITGISKSLSGPITWRN